MQCNVRLNRSRYCHSLVAHTPPKSKLKPQGSVVLRPVPEFTRCSGVPAKVTSVLRQHQANLKVRWGLVGRWFTGESNGVLTFRFIDVSFD